MIRLHRTPAVERLEWILAGLDGAEDWGADVDSVLAPEFTAVVAPDVFVDRVRTRTQTYAPVVVVGVDVSDHTAKARLRRPDGDVDVLSCEVEPEPPHRITMTWMLGMVPAGLTPRLPMDFADSADFGDFGDLDGLDGAQSGRRAALVIFSGVPGSGKSTIAEATGRKLNIPVFAIDWLLGALTPFGGRHFAELWDIGVEQLTTLALRQLTLGQSAILDTPVEDHATRVRWRSLARRANADFKVIVCTCSDPKVHRARVEDRHRGIPGWHDGGDWTNVARRLAKFPSWDEEALIIDSIQPPDRNLAAVLDHLGR
ncbi:ATP-binding protein [Actinopolymorpha sp. B11F2]|uniref:AAA family ATPase n=1 Tax=Actinopolymorpha sp. B11F2 TaxID=3160862 RepID=UPI0032E5213E